MTMEQFRHWLKQQIQALKTPEEPDMGHWAEAASVVKRAAATALSLGLLDVYRKCHFVTRVDVSPVLTPRIARETLSECLAGLPREPKETITNEELRTITGWSRTTIWRRRQEGKIPEPRKEGGKQYWLRSDLTGIL